MAEPTSTAGTSLVAVAGVLVGPIAGDYAVIVFASLAGSLWALARGPSMSRGEGARLVLRVLLTAVALTGGAALWLEHNYHWPAKHLLAPLAFIVGLFGDRWTALVDLAWARLMDRLRGVDAHDGGKQ